MAFRRGSKDKMWRNKAKPTWHHFGGNLSKCHFNDHHQCGKSTFWQEENVAKCGKMLQILAHFGTWH
jgi:hypothetical protein